MSKVEWDIPNEGRSWDKDEALPRYFMQPDKLQKVGGKFVACEEERETLLCLLLENVGADRVV